MSTICLIRPPRVTSEGFFAAGAAIPPVGLAYIKASLETLNYRVIPIDAVGEDIENYYRVADFPDALVQGLFFDSIINKIPSDSVFIGISCMFSCEWFLYESLIKRIKNSFPATPIVLGGEHVTAEAMNIINICPEVDYCVSGEGEVTIIELVKAIVEKHDLAKVHGITYRLNGKAYKNNSRERIKNIDSIALPSWEGIPVHRYHQVGYSMASLNRKSMPIVASRGCPYRCTFCTSPQMWGTDLNLRNPKLVIEEIKKYKEKYDIEHIDFLDIVGVLNRAWVKELLTLLIEADLKITWLHGAGTRSEILDEEILELFKKSNVLRVFYAPESGSKETLKRIKKRVNLEKISKSMIQSNELGLSMRAPLIYGFPGQTLKEAMENLFYGFYMSYIGVDDVVAHAFSAHPGTELHSDLIRMGNINVQKLIEEKKYNSFLRNEFSNKVQNLRSWSQDIPNWSLPFFQYGGMFFCYLILFFFHPQKIIKMFNRVFLQKKPLTLLDHIFYSLFFKRRLKINKLH